MVKSEITSYKKSTSFQKVRLTCCKCLTTHTVRTADKTMYSESTRKNWTCILCDMKNKREMKNGK